MNKTNYNLDKRVRFHLQTEYQSGIVIYLMEREQRVSDNWSLIYAQQQAIKQNQKLLVLYFIDIKSFDANHRNLHFFTEGLKEVGNSLTKLNIPFQFILAEKNELLHFIFENNVALLVSDFNPLKYKQRLNKFLKDNINIPFIEVDSHNIIPYFEASDKLEFAAYTIRPKIHRKINEFLTEYPSVLYHSENDKEFIEHFNSNDALKKLSDSSSFLPDWIIPGEKAALNSLNQFVISGLESYAVDRNNPCINGQSNLSPYLHYGHISAQRIALEVNKIETINQESKEVFLEELIVRKELSDNFCYFNSDYDRFEGFHNWAKTTLNEHRNDKRDYIYTHVHFENAQTHDSAWNAAQIEMLTTGKMHGYMRMYWAKKILEWTNSPEEALDIAIYLNDKYSLDGTDPNGYTGIAWSIGGVHDRAWNERGVFGKIRFMNYNGLKRKFNLIEYEKKWNGLEINRMF